VSSLLRNAQRLRSRCRDDLAPSARHDPASIAKSISAIIEAPQQIVEMSERLKSGIDKWVFDDVVAGYRNVYDELTRGRGTPRT